MDDKYFIDWESHFFGYGYGTGENFTVPALKRLFELLEDGRTYDYRKFEADLGQLAAWLLINVLCRAGILEYGTSPRHGWISKRGEILRDYLAAKTNEQLLDVLGQVDEGYVHCFPDLCNCTGTPCRNPLWVSRQQAHNS